MSFNFHLNPLVKAATVAAMTVSATILAQPAQKASAQVTPPLNAVVTGAGASSITTLADFFRSEDNRYIITGSGLGRDSFGLGGIDFAATDINPGVDADGNLLDPNGQVVVNEANLNVVFPYNVTFEDGTPFDATIDATTACRIIRGDANNVDEDGNEDPDPTNWSEVTNADGDNGPDLPIIRVVRGDVSGTTQAVQDGFIQQCNDAGVFIDSIVPEAGTTTGFDDGTIIPNQNDNDIIVTAATDDGFTVSPFFTGDDNNSGSYSLGVISAVQNNNGAIGYTESAIANAAGQPVATESTSGTSLVAVGPTYFVFRQTYGTEEKAVAAFNVCLAVTDTNNLAAAGFSEDEFGDDAVDGGNVDACGSIQGPQ